MKWFMLAIIIALAAMSAYVTWFVLVATDNRLSSLSLLSFLIPITAAAAYFYLSHGQRSLYVFYSDLIASLILLGFGTLYFHKFDSKVFLTYGGLWIFVISLGHGAAWFMNLLIRNEMEVAFNHGRQIAEQYLKSKNS